MYCGKKCQLCIQKCFIDEKRREKIFNKAPNQEKEIPNGNPQINVQKKRNERKERKK